MTRIIKTDEDIILEQLYDESYRTATETTNADELLIKYNNTQRAFRQAMADNKWPNTTVESQTLVYRKSAIAMGVYQAVLERLRNGGCK